MKSKETIKNNKQNKNHREKKRKESECKRFYKPAPYQKIETMGKRNKTITASESVSSISDKQ